MLGRRGKNLSRGLYSACFLGVFATLAPASASAFVWPNVPDQVARSLQASDVVERRLAAQRLGELPREIALPLVRSAIGDPDIEVRLAVASVAIAHRMPAAGDLVLGWLSEGDARLRLSACQVIRVSPTDRSVVALGRVLGDPDPGVRLAAASAMGASGLADAVSPLLGHLDDPSPEVRAEVARALGRIGDARAVVPLVGKVQDGVSEVRRAVARALGELGDPRAASALAITLQDNIEDVRVEAVRALGHLGSDEATLAIGALLEAPPMGSSGSSAAWGSAAVSSPRSDDDVRAAALAALGSIRSEQAIKMLIAALAKEDPSDPRPPVREALRFAGKAAIEPLIATLHASPSPMTAAGAALALGDLGARGAEAAIVRAMERGVVPARYGLRALAGVGSDAALPAVLERLEDPDAMVRREAVRAATALLDPSRPDGRAVDPVSAALRDPATPPAERVDLVRLLGRTGTPRAQAALLSLTSTKTLPLRLAALGALGSLGVGSAAVDAALLAALEDESADVRLHAATALARVGTAATVKPLLAKLGVAAQQDRGAIGIAISGAASRAEGKDVAAALQQALGAAPDPARDALIEALGRMREPAAGRALATLGQGAIDDRRKVAEALAGHPEQRAALLALAKDPDPGVRAASVWSLGAAGKGEDVAELKALLQDPDINVAGNAAASVGRIAGRDKTPALATEPLCAALVDPRSYIRANALGGLAIAQASCEGDPARDLVLRDPSAPVRLAAANYLGLRVAREGGPSAEPDRRALARCVNEDHDGEVASRCVEPLFFPEKTQGVSVFVVPDGGTKPLARAPFALLRADGLMRLGVADRRGEIYELDAPVGSVRLMVPAPLVR